MRIMFMKPYIHLIFGLAAIILLAPGPNTAFAQKGFFKPDAIVIGEETDEYKPMTYENLSKMYWTIGKFEFDDQVAIEQFLIINECDIYKKFSNNEFEFQEIIKATGGHLKNNLAAFPTKFEILVPIKLENYDIEEEVFWVEKENAPVSVTRVDLNSFWPEMDCRLDNRSELSLYPTGMIIVFNRPFTINKVPVDPQVARLYMEEVARKFANNPHAYERTVYLRVKVRLVQFRSQWTRGQETRAEVFGRLEGYEIYADVKKQKLMYREDFLDRRIRKARERKPVVGEGAVVEAESFDDSSEQETEPEE